MKTVRNVLGHEAPEPNREDGLPNTQEMDKKILSQEIESKIDLPRKSQKEIQIDLPLWRGEARRAQGEEHPEIEHQEMHPEPLSAEDLTSAIYLAAQKAYNANEHTYQGTCYYPKRQKPESINTPSV